MTRIIQTKYILTDPPLHKEESCMTLRYFPPVGLYINKQSLMTETVQYKVVLE